MEHLGLICRKHDIREVFREVKTTGLANSIFMSESYVLRIPTEHEEAVRDALTEAVAAPLALSHGIKTRKLVAFDNSHDIIGKPYSIWERVEGCALSELGELDHPTVWEEVGAELKKLHASVRACDDANDWLDNPDREYATSELKQALLGHDRGSKLLRLVEELEDGDIFRYQKRFVHGDTHSGNILCRENALASIIDWGDAGWGDPAIDFYMVPAKAVKWVVAGYLSADDDIPDGDFFKRIVMDKIALMLESGDDPNEVEKEITGLIRDLSRWSKMPARASD